MDDFIIKRKGESEYMLKDIYFALSDTKKFFWLTVTNTYSIFCTERRNARVAERNLHGYPLKKELTVQAVVSAFYHKSPKNFVFAGESHDFWELIYVDKGRILITAGEQKYVLKAGELAFHCPNEFHAVAACENTTANFIVTAFECRSRCMRYFNHRIMVLDAFERECLNRALQEAEVLLIGSSNMCPSGSGIASSVPFGTQQMLQSAIEQLLISLYRRRDSMRIQQRVETYAQQNSYRQLAKNIRAYLEENISRRLTLEEIAAAQCCSVPQMKKLFRAQMGRGIIDFFIDLKISEAKRLIREGTMNFTQIAAALGYDNSCYFANLFKSRTDMTMTEYSRSIGE